MRLTDFLTGMGRVVAYHPNLKKITGSTTATLLLCQLLYWSDKTKDKDGWIWKTAADIEEETGLTYFEQKTARKALIALGFIDWEFKRLDHYSRWFVNTGAINRAWENLQFQPEKIAVKPAKEEELADEEALEKESEEVAKKSKTKKGDLVDGIVDGISSSANKRANRYMEIKDLIEKKFHINPTGTRWEKFIQYAYSEELRGRPIEKFISWALVNGFDARFWSADKMLTIYPQAFMNTTAVNYDNFIPPQQQVPNVKEEEYVPMPADIGRKKKLY